jgi:hypothetical protein
MFMFPRKGLHFSDWDVAMIPTADQWQEFWRVCDEIEVWSWPPILGSVHIIDGLRWNLELEFGCRRVVSNGQVVGSPPGFSEKLMRFHQSLQAMTDWQKGIR